MAPPDQDHKAPQAPIYRYVFSWVFATLVLFFLVFLVLRWIAPKGPGTDQSDAYDLARSAVAVVASVGGATIAAIAIRRQRSAERTVELSAQAAATQAAVFELESKRHGNEQVYALRDRFLNAATQLGHQQSAAVRIAGLVAMATLAEDWVLEDKPADAQACIDVVAAYLRMPPEAALRAYMRGADQVLNAETHNELEVRQTAQRLIVRFLREKGRETSRRKVSIDLSSAELHDFDASHARFYGRTTWFSSCYFSGSGTWFNNAVFASTGRTMFRNAAFAAARTNFESATFHFSPQVIFDKAEFRGRLVSFADVEDTSTISLSGSTLSTQTDLRWTDGSTFIISSLPQSLLQRGMTRVELDSRAQ